MGRETGSQAMLTRRGLVVCALLALLVASSTALDPSCDGIVVNETVIDSQVWQIYWLDQDHQIVYVLTVTDGVWRSEDEGMSFSQQFSGQRIFDLFQFAAEERIVAMEYADSSRGSTKLYFSDDYGSSFTLVTVPYLVWAIEPHPTDKDIAVAQTHTTACYTSRNSPDCSQDLVYTTDGGHTWTMVQTGVYVWYWAVDQLPIVSPMTDQTLFYMVTTQTGIDFRYTDIRKANVLRSNDYGQTSTVVLQNAPGLLPYGGVLFLADVNATGAASLYTSTDGGVTKTAAIFPHDVSLSENGYTIIDVADKAVVIHVDHSSSWIYDWGNVYTSDAADSEFVLSLEFNSRFGSMVDMRRVHSVEGVYWANHWVMTQGQSTPGHGSTLRTVMSFDLGGNWYNIDPPAACPPTEPNCHLQLHGPTNTWYGSVYSRDDAPGILLGTGVIAENLPLNTADDADTYFSRDAGATWTMALPDYHTYEIGDSGALVVAVETSPIVTTFQWTATQGIHWFECQFTADPTKGFDVTNVYNEPTGHSSSFLMYGTRNDQGVIVTMDMSGTLPRACAGADKPDDPSSDYESWVPIDPHDNSLNCLLGSYTEIVRRKQSKQCSVPDDFQHSFNQQPCACTIEDYECMECFVEVIDLDPSSADNNGIVNRTCVLDTVNCPDFSVDSLKPSPCTDTWQYYGGLRLIAGDMCNQADADSTPQPQILSCSGDTPQPSPMPTRAPGTSASSAASSSSSTSGHGNNGGGSSAGIIVLVVALIAVCCVLVAAAAVAVLYFKNDSFRERVQALMPQQSRGFLPVSTEERGGSDSKSLLSDYDGDDDDTGGII